MALRSPGNGAGGGSSGGGGAPTGPAGGDLSGTYPNPLVAQSTTLNIYPDGGNTVAQRNGTNSQTLLNYNTYTDASNYERFAIRWASGNLTIGTEQAGTGGARGFVFSTSGAARWLIAVDGTFSPVSDNNYRFGGPSLRIQTVFTASADSKGSTVFTTTPQTLISTSAYLTVMNMTTANTVNLPTSPIQDERRSVLNIGTGQTTVAYTGITGTAQTLGATTTVLAQYSSVTFHYLGATLGWVKVA